MLGIPLLFGDFDDVDQFEPRVEPVTVQQHVRAVVDESRRRANGAAIP